MASENTRNFRYNIYINGNDAVNQLSNIERETVKLEKDLVKLRKENKQDSEEWKQKINVINDNEQKMKKLAQQIDITKLSVGELRKYRSMLYSQKNIISPQNITQLKNIDKEIAAVNTRLNQLRGTAATINKEGFFSRMAGNFNKYFTMAGTAIATVTGLSMTFRRLAEDVAKMDDIYASVMKTTNMSREEVVELNEAFKKMDTRTSREQLNALAETAGRLGKSSKEDVMQFVEVVIFQATLVKHLFDAGGIKLFRPCCFVKRFEPKPQIV